MFFDTCERKITPATDQSITVLTRSALPSWTEETSSPVPETGRLSKSDTEKARAAVLEGLARALSARPCKTNGASWARAFARAARNCAVSALHLTPTEPRQRCWLFWVWRSRPGAKETPSLCLWRVELPPESQPVRHNFQPAAVKSVVSRQVSPCRARTCWSSHEHRRPCKPAQLRTQEENLSSPTPCLRTRCVIVAKLVE